METYTGYVKTPQDAITLFEACRMGQLPRVQRRLSEKERRLIKSGSVFVWDEREAGMRRWTDGKSWSASRVNGSFLTYREMEGKKGPGSFSSSGPGTTRSALDDHDSGLAEAPDGYRYRPDGLTKQSFSITTSTGQHLHLISYSSRSDLSSGRLILPTQDPALRHIRPAKGMYPDSTFQDASSSPATNRSPVSGAPHSTSPHGSAASTPQYAQSRSMAPSYSPAYAAWPPSPMNTPPLGTPGQHYSPYSSAYFAGPSPVYGGGHMPPHHTRVGPGPTAFDMMPVPAGSTSMPPPAQMIENKPLHFSATGAALAPLQAAPSRPPQILHPLDAAPGSHPLPAAHYRQHLPSNAPEEHNAVKTEEEDKPKARTGTGMVPSIHSLINHSPPPPAERHPAPPPPLSQYRTFGSRPMGESGLPGLPEKKPYAEDNRALRQLDKAFVA